jgi:hypothetical protein
MSSARRTALVVFAAALGIALAAAITWGTSQLVRQRIGLASEPLTAGRQLLPSTSGAGGATGTGGSTGTSTATSPRTATRTVTTTVRETAPAAPPAPLPVQTSTVTTPSAGEPSDRTGAGAKGGGGDAGRRGDD